MQLDEAATKNVSCAAASKDVNAAWTSAAYVFSSSEQVREHERQLHSELSPIAAIPPSYEGTSSGVSWVPAAGSSVQHSNSAGPFHQSKFAATGPRQPLGSVPNLFLAHEANRLLSVYREQFAPRFPFIDIPDGLPAEDLRNQKPWLYRTIMMVAAQDNRSRQQELGEHIFSEMACAMLLRGEKSLDMLQSLCVCNLW